MSTTVYNARTLTSGYESDSTAVKVVGDFASFTAAATIVNGANPPTPGRQIVIKYLITSEDLGNTPATSSLTSTGRFVFTTDGTPSATYTRSASLPNDDADGSVSDDTVGNIAIASGTHMYVWLSHDAIGNPATFTLTVTPGSDGLQTTSSGYLLLNSTNDLPIILNGEVGAGEIPNPTYPEWTPDVHLTFENDDLTNTEVTIPVTVNDGAVTYDTGVIDRCLVLDGTSSITFDVGRGNGDDVTLALWVKILNPLEENSQGIICIGDDAQGNGSLFELLYHNGDTQGVWLHALGSQITSDVVIDDGNWHHLAATYSTVSTPTLALYIDGVLIDTLEMANDAGGPIFVGCRPGVGGTTGGTNFFKGRVADVIVYNRALTLSEIEGLRDMSANVNTTLTGLIVSADGGVTTASAITGSTVTATSKLIAPIVNGEPTEAGVLGQIYYNSDDGHFYGYTINGWLQLSNT
jgi:hypothetical protein